MTIIFKYIHVPREDGTLRKAPYIPVWASTASGRMMKVVALIDSGADETVIPKDLAIILGLKEKGRKFKTGGIGGSIWVKQARFSFTLKGDRETYPLDIRALIVQDKNVDIPLILGRHGFFEEFEITLRQDQEKIMFKKIHP